MGMGGSAYISKHNNPLGILSGGARKSCYAVVLCANARPYKNSGTGFKVPELMKNSEMKKSSVETYLSDDLFKPFSVIVQLLVLPDTSSGSKSRS